MARASKLSRDQWERVRQAWEHDKRKGFLWLVDEMGLPVTRQAVGKRARYEGWQKAHGFAAASALKNHGKPCLENLDNQAWKTMKNKLGKQPFLGRESHGQRAVWVKPLPGNAEFMESTREFSEALRARVEFLDALRGSPDFAFLAVAAVRSPVAMGAALEAIIAAHNRDAGEVKTLVHGFSNALIDVIRERDATIEILMTLVETQKKTRVQSKRVRR